MQLLFVRLRHAYQLALQAPEHSAMFEVSWCVGLYVTILLLEFLPVPLERYGYTRALAIWRDWQGAYVAFAVTLFVYMFGLSCRTIWRTCGAALTPDRVRTSSEMRGMYCCANGT